MAAADVAAIAEQIRAHAYAFTDERELQDGLAIVLADVAGLHREHSFSPQDRIDFLLPDGVGIEVKIDGSLSDLARQVHRYAQREEITALIVVTNRLRLAELPETINGKPVVVVKVGGL